MADFRRDLNGVEMKNIASINEEEFKQEGKNKISKGRILKNLLVICFGFLFLFSAFQALSNLQSTLNVEGNIGLVSQSVIYASVILSSLFLPKLVIKKLGCKFTLLLSILAYAPYVAANFYPNMGTFVPTAVLLGLGAAPLWSAKCTYINEISSMYSIYDEDTVDIVTSKFFGIFFLMFQNTQILGNLVSYFVLRPADSTNVTISLDTGTESEYFVLTNPRSTNEATYLQTNSTCGLHFRNQINGQLEPPPDDKRCMLIGIYLGCVILAAVIVGVFLDPLKREEKKDEGVFSRIVATARHLRKADQLLLVPLTIFIGIQQAFILGDYTKAYVACVWGVHSVGLVFICFGVVNAISSFVSGRITKFIPRKFLMLLGMAGNIGICIVLYLWKPVKDEFLYAFIIVGVWGLSDAIWMTQINALYGILFRSEEEAAFANCSLWRSLGFSISFAYSSFLSVAFKINILLAFLIVGIAGYLTVEIRTSRKEMYVVTH